eukprot:13055926-Alexandrium_andersonii.AAC.1
MALDLGLNSFNSASPCFYCQANTSTRPWTDWRQEAAWRATVWTARGWLQATPRRHPLFELPGVSV